MHYILITLFFFTSQDVLLICNTCQYVIVLLWRDRKVRLHTFIISLHLFTALALNLHGARYLVSRYSYLVREETQ